MPITTSGVSLSEVGAGRKYDLAVGYSTNGLTATMYGFLLRPGSELEEITDLQDLEHLVQVASPNATDRYSRFPKVSQGSWVGGGRQEFFIDPTRFYSTDGGLDTTKPGSLALYPGWNPLLPFPAGWTYGAAPTQGVMPVASDGGYYYIGGKTSPATANVASNSPMGNYTVGPSGANEVLDINTYPTGLIFSVAGAGMYIQPKGGLGVAATQLSSDYSDSNSFHSHAIDYFAGLIYYPIQGPPAKLMAISPTAGAVAGTPVFTLPTGEAGITTVCSFSGGVFFASSLGAGDILYQNSILYMYSGSGTPTRVGTIAGYTVASINCSGTIYILALVPQPFFQTYYSYTLYSLSGTTLTLVDDFRYLNQDFRTSASTNLPGFPRMCYDGRFLYVALPGVPINVYDLSNPSSNPFILGVTNPAITPVAYRNQSHGVAITSSVGLVEVGLDNAGVFVGYEYSFLSGPANSQSGVYTSSSFDFSTPNLTKLFRSVEVELRVPLGSGSTVYVGFRVDNTTGFTTLNTVSITPNKLVAFLPAGTKGSRIQIQLTLSGMGPASPIVRSYSVNATVGRVWRATVMAPHAQSLHSYGEDDQAATAKDLIAVIQNIYRVTGGSCVLMVPSALTSTLSEQVNATLQEYHIHQVIPGPREDSIVPTDMEAYVDLVLVEDV